MQPTSNDSGMVLDLFAIKDQTFAIVTACHVVQIFEAARDLARDLDSCVVLRDEAGFERGHINVDGSWRMYQGR